MSRINYSQLGPGAVKLPQTQPATGRSLPEVGRIAIGETVHKEGGKSYPRSTDYFVIRSAHAQLIYDRYGEQPKELPVFFYSDDIKEVCRERLEIRNSAGRLVGEGDGEQFRLWVDAEKQYRDFSTKQHPDLIERVAQKTGSQWLPTLTIRVAVKDVPVLGYWQFSTHGAATTIANLRDRFDACLRDLGMVRFLPFMLTVKKVKSDKPGDTRQYPVVDLIPQLSIETGLRLGQFVAENPDFNPARLATYTTAQLAAPDPARLLLGRGE